MEYPYFKGLEADRYSFYRVPKALVKADLFQKMSGDAKLLHAVLLDRMSLSIKNGWQDKHGNAYIICTIEEVMDSIHCARQKAVKLLDELEQEFRLIERRRQGLGRPNLLYVKDLYGDKPVQEAMTELLAEFGCDAAQGRIMDAAELREQADTAAEQQAEVLKEKLAAERPAPEETLSFYVAECLEFTFAGEFHDHLTMKEALEAYDKIPSERMNADKCIGFCIEEDGGFVGMYELVVNDKVQRENINSINYFRDDKLVQQAISDMEKLMEARQKSKEQERSSTKKSVLDALRSLKAKKQEQPAQEQDKPKKAKKKGMEL